MGEILDYDVAFEKCQVRHAADGKYNMIYISRYSRILQQDVL